MFASTASKTKFSIGTFQTTFLANKIKKVKGWDFRIYLIMI